MTARELIKELKKIGEMDLPVCIEDLDGFDEIMNVKKISFYDGDSIVVLDI